MSFPCHSAQCFQNFKYIKLKVLIEIMENSDEISLLLLKSHTDCLLIPSCTFRTHMTPGGLEKAGFLIWRWYILGYEKVCKPLKLCAFFWGQKDPQKGLRNDRERFKTTGKEPFPFYTLSWHQRKFKKRLGLRNSNSDYLSQSGNWCLSPCSLERAWMTELKG